MGMTIELVDQDYQYCLDYASGKTNIMALTNASRIIKAVADGTRYEDRLKADMVLMLEELKEQLREMHEDFFETEHFDEAYGVSNSMDIIQQKIDALKE